MKAIAISNFPSDVNENKFRPEFLSRGFDDLTFVTGPDFKNVSIPSDVDVVFCFFDLISHNQHDTAKALVKKAKKRFVLLNRKISTWSSDVFTTLKQEEIQMAPPKSVRDEDLHDLFDEYADLLTRNATQDEILTSLSKFWTVRPLSNYRQLKNYLDRIDPKHFSQKYRNYVYSSPAAIVLDEQIDTPEKPLTENINIHEESDEQSTLIKMYEDENARLISKTNDLQKEIDVLKSQVSNMNASVQQDKLRKLIPAIKLLVESGLLSQSEAYSKIASLV